MSDIQIFILGWLPSDTYCLKYIYFYNPHQCLYNKITLNQQNNKYERIINERIDNNLKLDFTKGKEYNVK
jgi:hypothetical protein